jgi:hypothetical protein
MFCFESELCHSDLWGNSMLSFEFELCHSNLWGTETRGSVIPSTRQVTLTSGTPQSRTDHDFGDVKTDTDTIGDSLPTDSISTGTIVAIVII